MRIPTKGDTEMYDVSENKYASVKSENSGKYWVTISSIERLEKNQIITTVKDGNSLWFDTFEEVKQYLLETADEAYKDQFRD